jgi:hypothetical protein
VFFDPTGRPSLAAGRAWSADVVDDIVRHYIDAAIIGSSRWRFDIRDGPGAPPDG